MDFAVCPGCGQSVLDDDASECPFCGASMKGGKSGGTATKPSPKPAASAPATKPGAPKPPAAKPAAPDDFPFDADVPQGDKAIQASATPSKLRTLKVVCPMCEAEGYVASTAAGKSVKCANPKCLVPVFTAPAAEAPKPPPPPSPPKKRNPLLLGLVAGVVVAVLGGVAFFLAGQPSNRQPQGQLLTPEQIVAMKKAAPPDSQSSGDAATTPDPNEAGTAVPSTTETKAPAVNTQEVLTATLKMMNEVSLLSGAQNRSRPYCRRLAAESFAWSKDLAGAKGQLDSLIKVGPDLPFYRVPGWVELFWLHRSKQQTKEAEAALDQALQSAAKLPTLGRDQLDVSTRLATALAVAGRIPAAKELLLAHESSEWDGELSAAWTWWLADPTVPTLQTFLDLAPVVPRKQSHVAVTLTSLVLRGEIKAAQDFLAAWTEPEARADAVSGFVDALAWRNPQEATIGQIEAVVAPLDPATQALAWARVSRVFSQRGQKELARTVLGKASQSLQNVNPPEAFAVPEIKPLMKWKPTSPVPLTLAATAAVELAVAQQAAGDDVATVQQTLQRALQYAQGIGPAESVIAQMLADIDSVGPALLRERMKQQLDIKSDDDARQAVNTYRRILNDLQKASNAQADLTRVMFTRAVRWSLEDAIWGVMTATEASTASTAHLLKTDLPIRLIERFRARSKADSIQAVESALMTAEITTPMPTPQMEFDKLLADGKHREAVVLLAQSQITPEVREYLTVTRAAQLAATGRWTEAVWPYIMPLHDIVLREQAYEVVAQIGARQQQVAPIRQQIEAVVGATEKVALGKGLIAGLTEAKTE